MGQGKSTQTTSIPEWQNQFMTNTVLPMGEKIAQQPFQNYGGQYAPEMSGYTQQAGDVYSNLASQDYQAATQANFDAMRNNVLDPQVQAMARQHAQQMTGNEATIANAGAFGSRGDIYQAERDGAYEAGVANLMMQGYGQAQAQTMAQAGAQQNAASGLMGVGSAETALGAAQMGGEYDEFLREQNYPYQQFGALSGFGGGNYGQTTTSQKKNGLFDYLAAGASFLA